MNRLYQLCVACVILFTACEQTPTVDIPMPQQTDYLASARQLTNQDYYDKILGALVGSAIGDAMGASTEMWHRSDILESYGYITGLTTATREKSPEGTWDHNMIAGATTDDTRWKYVMGKYISQYRSSLSVNDFMSFIVAQYESQTKALADKSVQESTDVFDDRIEQINWIKEWARVAIAHQKGRDEFSKAQARFYGGEMSCAGMLYSPMFGLVKTKPEEAYTVAFDHAVFDIGYAKDISALTAAMTSLSLQSVSMDSIIDVIRFIDPYDYKNSRLIGRLTESIAMSADAAVKQAQGVQEADADLIIPPQFPGSDLEWTQLQHMYSALDRDKKAIAFHAGEIWQILIAGLTYGDGDFEKTIQFIANYGRDNDTVAAVAGMIVGGQVGFKNLPQQLKGNILKVSNEVIGIDLEGLARELSER